SIASMNGSVQALTGGLCIRRTTTFSPCPVNDTSWSAMSSLLLLGHSLGLVGRAGGELVLEDLARDVAGDLVDELDEAGRLVAGHLRADRGIQLGAGELDARPRDDERLDGLAPLRVRDPGHRDVRDLGVELEDVLDLLRVDVLAAGLDQVFGAVDHPQRAARLEHEHVAGVVPAALEG